MVPRCPFLALTATASASIRVRIQQLLAMKTPVEIVESPDRENIKISVTKIKGDPEVSFHWLTEKLKSEKNVCDKYIIYCRRIADCSNLYSYFKDEVKDTALFDMFHSRTVEKVKTKILGTIRDPKSSLRIIIATNAVGMGLDFDCNFVINYGPPSDYDAYLQQIGRVGRDGSASQAMLLYHGQQLRKLSPEMLSFVKSEDKCRRLILRKLYGDKSSHKEVTGCRCCDICEKMCTCNHCDQNAIPFQKYEKDEEVYDMERFVSEDDQDKLEVHLLGLKNDLDRSCSMYSGIISHGLSLHVIKLIMSNSKFVFGIDTLLDKCGIFHEETAAQVLSIFSAIFGDTDMELTFDEDSLQL